MKLIKFAQNLAKLLSKRDLDIQKELSSMETNDIYTETTKSIIETIQTRENWKKK